MHKRRPAHAAATAKVTSLVGSGSRLYMTAVTRFELFDGVEQFYRPAEERNRVAALIARYPTHALDPASADRGGAVHGSLRRQGITIDPEDAMIAGIALTRDGEVLTRNLKRFRQVPGLRVETY